MTNTPLIESFDDAVRNAIEFNSLTPASLSLALAEFGRFSHWYYFPEQNIFAPSKFVGYKNTTLDNYMGGEAGWEAGKRNSGKTKRALSVYFRELPKDSEDFQQLKESLDSYASGLGKKISAKVTLGKGAIHVPYDWNVTSLSPGASVSNGKGLRLRSEFTTGLSEVVGDDYESVKAEGKAKFRLHRQLERDRQIVRKAKLKRLNETGKLECDACGFNFEVVYGDLGEGFIEGHHKTPVAQLDGTTKTKISDLALLCANCHRMIHRRITMTVADLRKLVEQRSL